MTKTYRAILCGQPAEKSGMLCDWMVQEKKGNLSRVGKKTEPGAKEAKLSYTVLRKQFHLDLPEVKEKRLKNEYRESHRNPEGEDPNRGLIPDP